MSWHSDHGLARFLGPRLAFPSTHILHLLLHLNLVSVYALRNPPTNHFSHRNYDYLQGTPSL